MRVVPFPQLLLVAAVLGTAALGRSLQGNTAPATEAVPIGEVAVTAATPHAGSAGMSAVAGPDVADAVASTPAAHREVAVDAAVDAALEALSPVVRRSSHREALRTAFQAYFGYRSARPDLVRKPYLYFVDLGLGNRAARGYVFDMQALTLVDGPFTVAHGRGSSRTRDGVPTTFSNRPGSNASSLGLYLAQETYTFRGKSGGRAYQSVGLRMRGESGAFNDAARRRGIVAHGAPYVSASSAGRSEGCPAMEPARARKLLPMLANGGVTFLYSPNDERWLREDPWITTGSLAGEGRG